MGATLAYRFRELKEYVKELLTKGITPFIWGPPGIGKSSLAKEVAKELNAEFYHVDVPLLQPIDFLAAVPDREKKVLELYPGGYIPQKGPAVVCLDDLPHAKPFQQIPCMQIIQDRRIGPIKFADDVYFIATGNREEDYAGASTIISTIMNRVAHFELDPDLEEWKMWYSSQDELDEKVIGFLTAYPDHFLELPEEGKRTWPTPRSWEKCGKAIYGVNDENKLRAFVSATVGSHIASLFMAWWKYLKDINPAEVLKKGKIEVEDRTKLYAYMFSVTQYLKKHPEKIDTYGRNIISIIKNISGDYRIAFLKQLVVTEGSKYNTRLLEKLLKYDTERIITNYLSTLIFGNKES